MNTPIRSLSRSLPSFIRVAVVLAIGTGFSPAAASGAPPPLSSAPPPSASATIDQDAISEASRVGIISLQGGASQIIFFPSQDIFAPLLADPRQPTTTLELFGISNNPSTLQFNGNVGGDWGIARWESTKDGVNKSLQVGVMGGSFSRFGIFGASTYLIDSDFIVGLPVTARIGRFSERLFLYHESSHTGYNYTTLSGISKTSDFGQEILQEISSFDITRNVRIYGGAAYRVFGLAFYPTLNDSLIFLGGFEATTHPILPVLGGLGRGYIAANIESMGINGYGPEEDLQIGLLIHRPGSDLQIRPMLDFYNGNSYMGDLLFTRDEYAALGISFDF